MATFNLRSTTEHLESRIQKRADPNYNLAYTYSDAGP